MSRLVYHDAAERERMYDVMARMRPPFSIALASLIVPAALAGPIYGWTCMLPLVAAVLAYASTDLRLRSLRHPERWAIGTWVFAELMILLMIGLADGPRAYLLSVPIVPIVGMTMIVGRRTALACAAGLAVGLCATAGLTMWNDVVALPPVLIAPVVMTFACVLAAISALEGGFVSRRTQVVDPLTGLLNRVALQTRSTELAAQARASGERVALVVVELDDFRRVRADHGAAVADAVLAEAARRLRTEADGAGTVARFDGATFVALCPGVSRTSAVALAERLRHAIGASAIDDVTATASIGIAVYRGEHFDFATLFARGAAAAGAASEAGGDQVCLAPDDGVVSHVSAVPEHELPVSVAMTADGDWDARVRAAADPSPLMPDAIARAHAVDALGRTRRLVVTTAAVLGAGLVINGFWAGWMPLVPAAIGAVAWVALSRVVPHIRRPEYPAFAGLALIIVASGASAAAAGTVGLFMLPAVACAVLGACSGFPRLGALILCVLGFVTTAAAGLAVGAAAIAENPVILALPLAYVVGFAIMGEWMGRTAREHRVSGITDPLTGALNHAALDARIPALEQLAVDRAVTLVLLELRHDGGDAVIAEATERIAETLRPFDPVYRLGGDRFAVLLADPSVARRAAGRISSAITDEPIRGVPATVAIGVASVPAGDVCSFDALVAEARDALDKAAEQPEARHLLAA